MSNRSRDRAPRPIRPALPPAVLGAIVLLAGTMLIGSSWFSSIRFAVSILALIIMVIVLQHRKWWWVLPLLPIAVMWNPAWPLYFPDPVWMVAHYIGALVFIVVGTLARVFPSE